ncbi:MAG: hypothetical protein ACLQVD_04510 [Capsulimonadaceae bacterium]
MNSDNAKSISTGLALQISSPAVSVLRSVQRLQANLALERALYRQLTSVWADTSARRFAEEWVEAIEARYAALTAHSESVMPRGRRLIRWLAARQVRQPRRLARSLAHHPIELDDLERLAAGVGDFDLSLVLTWAAAALAVDDMAATARASAVRVTELVAAIEQKIEDRR